MGNLSIVLVSSNGIWGAWILGEHQVGAANGTGLVWWWDCSTVCHGVCAEVNVGQG